MLPSTAKSNTSTSSSQVNPSTTMAGSNGCQTWYNASDESAQGHPGFTTSDTQ